MSDIDEIRARLIDSRSTATWSSAGGLGLSLLVACGIGFAVIFFGPRILGLGGAQTSLNELKPTESTPSILRVGEPLPQPPVGTVVANYNGKSAEEIGKIADQVCFDRAQTRDAHWGTTPRLTTQSLANFRPEHMRYFNELLGCLLSEGTQRYCARSERRMIVAEIAMYFRGIASRNKAATWYFDESRPKYPGEREYDMVKSMMGAPDKATQFRNALVEVDPAVVNAITYRLRDGLLTTANRDEIAAAAPPELRERFTRIDPPKPACPAESWWAFWR